MIAFISDGKLFVEKEEGNFVEVESAFIRAKLDDAERERELNAWKRRGGGGDSPFYDSNFLWGRQGIASQGPAWRVRDLSLVSEKSLYYLISNSDVTGLFHYDIEAGEERRIFHKNEFYPNGFDYSPSREEFVFSIGGTSGTVDLELYSREGKHITSLTGGDSLDVNPRFSQANPSVVYFQSAGIARNDEGHPLAVGPMSIMRLDAESGELEEILSDEKNDYLLPGDDAEGNLYCIRRPWRSVYSRRPADMIKDFLFFPFRLIGAIVGFLNIFIDIFGKGPRKKAAGGPMLPDRGQSDKFVQVLGETINYSRLKQKEGDEPSLVPGSWELIRRSPDGEISVVEKNVSFFCIIEKHRITTNGFGIYRTDESNKRKKIHRHDIVEVVGVSKV